jgi:hypothetical protein
LLKHEYFPGQTRVAIEAGTAGAPATTEYITSLSLPVGVADNYGRRVSGLFVPATTGDYVFFVCSDDDSDLFLSTDDTKANKRLIAQETVWSNPNKWVSSGGGSVLTQKRSDSWSPDGGLTKPYASGIRLVAGQKYYIEAVHREGGGGDNLAATFKLLADADPADDTPTAIVDTLIGMYAPTAITVTTPPANVSTTAGLRATFSVVASTDSEFAPLYQWRRNGTPVSGATASTFSLAASPDDNGAQIDCVVSVPPAAGFAPVTTAAATLTVTTASFVTGGVKEEFFPGVTSRAAVYGERTGTPSAIRGWSSLEAPLNVGNDFARRVTTWFSPPVTGDYVFFVCSDDDTDLFVSTDESPANKRLVAHESSWSDNRAWTTSGGNSDLGQKRSDQYTPDQGGTFPYSAGIRLVQGERYYIEAVHHEGGGGDDMSATFKLLTEPDPVDGTATLLTGSVIGYYTPTVTRLNVTKAPTDIEAFEDQAAKFEIVLSTDSELTPWYQWQRDGQDIPGATKSTYSLVTKSTDNGATFSVKYGVFGFPQFDGQSAVVKLTVRKAAFITGILKREIWFGTGYTRAGIEAGPTDDPADPTAAYPLYITRWQTTDIANNYVQRITGFFIPPTTGAYVFFLSADDDADLWLSTDETPANAQLLARESNWNNARQWLSSAGGTAAEQLRSDTFVDPVSGATPGAGGIQMVAGRRYFIQGVHHEGGGGDNFAITYKLVTEADPANGDQSKMTGSVIGSLVPEPTFLNVTKEPEDITTSANTTVGFTVTVATDALFPPNYQWRKNNVNIPGATSAYYSPFATLADDGAKYDCVVTLSGMTTKITSRQATLHVTVPITVQGSLRLEKWNGFNREFIESGNVPAPTTTTTLSAFETGTDVADNYCQRITGFFTPAVTGDYVFFLASDDDTDLFLSTDDKPANQRLIAHESGYSGSRRWVTTGGSVLTQKRSDQWSPDGGTTVPYASGIHLEAGKSYFIQAVHHEGGGGDNFAVTFKLIADPDPVDGDAPAFTAAMLSHSEAVVVTPPALTVARGASGITVSWAPAGGRLQSATALSGASTVWTDVGTANPAVIPNTGSQLFLRVVTP